MTPLDAALAALDEAALVAHASKGIVIRAAKDAEAGKCHLLTRERDAARIETEGCTVEIVAKGLGASRCSCPAVGVCRHMISAVFALKAHATATPEPFLAEAPAQLAPKIAPARQPPKALPAIDIAATAFESLESYAARLWPQALALAETPVEIERSGSIAVHFTDTEDRVVFPAGQDFQQALHKGKTSRTRLAITAAALVLARDAGRPLPERVEQSPKDSRLDLAALARVQEALRAAAVLLGAGSHKKAQDRLFSVAILARTEAVPRLASELRNLSRRLGADTQDDFSQRPGELLAGIARVYALAEAIRANPDDPLLTGILARSFIKGTAKSVALIGAEHWRNAAGARGMTMVFADVATGQLHRALEARGAGTDLMFSETAVYHRVIWMLASPHDILGRIVTLPDAAVALDGGLGLNQRAVHAGGSLDIRRLADKDSAFRQWSAMSSILQRHTGLRRGAAEPLMLLFPAGVEAPDFDAYEQIWRWDWRDSQGHVATLHFSENLAQDPEALTPHLSKVIAGLVAVGFGPKGITLRLLTLWLSDDATKAYPMQQGMPSAPGQFKTIAARLKERLVPRTTTLRPLDPLKIFFDRALEAVASEVGRPEAPLTQQLADEAFALGVPRLHQMLSAFVAMRDADTALRLAYSLTLYRNNL